MHLVGSALGMNLQDIFTRVDSLSPSRVIIWLGCIVHRRGADIPDKLTTVPHHWILRTVERRVITVSRADRENNWLQMYGLTWFYISSALAGRLRKLRAPCRRGC
jgi:hypothetical protein